MTRDAEEARDAKMEEAFQEFESLGFANVDADEDYWRLRDALTAAIARRTAQPLVEALEELLAFFGPEKHWNGVPKTQRGGWETADGESFVPTLKKAKAALAQHREAQQ